MKEQVVISKSVWEQIENTLGNTVCESGGIIGKINGKISFYYYDTRGGFLVNEYMPNVQDINQIIDLWKGQDIVFTGFIHSHPNDRKELSYGDVRYFVNILKHNRMKHMSALLYLAKEKHKLFCYEVYDDGFVEKQDYTIE